MHSDSPFCHNCGIRLTGKFCAACGQKAVPLTVTLHDFLHELTHEMLHVDGRIVQSIRRLMLSPGFLTREYIQGRRASWISPIRLYLIFSLLFFGLSALTGFRVGVNTPKPNGLNFSFGNKPQMGITAETDEDAEAFAKANGFASMAELQQALNHALLAWIPRLMFILLPFFAMLVALAYRRVDSNYLHHLIFAVHVHAAWFAAQAVGKVVELASYPIGYAVQQLAVVFAVVYVVLAIRRVYGKVRFSFARIAFVLVAYLAAFIAVLAAIVIPVVYRQFLPKLL